MSAPLKTAKDSRAIDRVEFVSVLAFEPINSGFAPVEKFGAVRFSGMDFVVFTWGKIGAYGGGRCDGLCSENLPHYAGCVNGNSMKKCYGSVTFQAPPSPVRGEEKNQVSRRAAEALSGW